jgi:hypothetical protein
VHVLAGDGTVVRDDRMDNTAGWSNLVTDDRAAGRAAPCSSISIDHNVITGYSTKFHWYETTGLVDGRPDLGTVSGQLNNLKTGDPSLLSTFGFADVISNQCGDAHIARNALVDMTDVSVVLFGVPGRQHSVVEDNTILSAGNHGWASMTMDPLFPASVKHDFAGATMRDNLVWTSPNGFLLLVAGIGTKPWFGDNTALATGPVFYTGNTSGRARINTQMALAVTRVTDARVTGNSLLADLRMAGLCPFGPYIGVDSSPGAVIDQPHAGADFASTAIPPPSQGCLTLHL